MIKIYTSLCLWTEFGRFLFLFKERSDFRAIHKCILFLLNRGVEAAKRKVGRRERLVFKGNHESVWITTMQICLKIGAIRVNAWTGLCQSGTERKTSQKTAKGISIPKADLLNFGRFHSTNFCGSIYEPFFTLFLNFLFCQNGRKGKCSMKHPMVLNILW